MGSLQPAAYNISHTYCIYLITEENMHTYVHFPTLSSAVLISPSSAWAFELGGFGAGMKCRKSRESSSAVMLVGTRQGYLLTDERKLLIGEAFGFLASFTISGLALGWYTKSRADHSCQHSFQCTLDYGWRKPLLGWFGNHFCLQPPPHIALQSVPL